MGKRISENTIQAGAEQRQDRPLMTAYAHRPVGLLCDECGDFLPYGLPTVAWPAEGMAPAGGGNYRSPTRRHALRNGDRSHRDIEFR